MTVRGARLILLAAMVAAPVAAISWQEVIGDAGDRGPASGLSTGDAHLVLAPVFLVAALLLLAVVRATRRRTHDDDDAADRH